MNFRKMYLLVTCLFVLSWPVLAYGEDKVSGKTSDKAVGELDFKDELDGVRWKSINDSVMGGVSVGDSYETEAGNRIFRGEISLKNNGGFSSIRTSGKLFDLSAYTGVRVKVRGDGRKYYFTARMNNRNMLAFWYPMETKPGEWSIFEIPFSSMYATSFGRKLKGIKLNEKLISSFGLMLYDKKDGDFNLELESIKVYK